MNYIKLKPLVNELTRLNEFIHGEVSTIGPDVDLIVEEVFVNIVNYSGCTFIRVNVEYEDSFLKMEFMDDGIQFNPIDLDSPNVPNNIEEAEIGGLGIHLVKNLADDLDYEYINNENHLKIIKKVKT
jgi:anti-sigma regulatory factor (Ser/Thr protein kinase)